MAGKLYVIGVGPGDPELMTLKAARLLRQVPCVIVPKGREEGSSLARSIVEQAVSLEGKEIVEAYFPMVKTAPHPDPLPRGEREDATAVELNARWNEAADAVLQRLDRGMDAAFITIGDPAIYSTFFYLYGRLLDRRPELAIEIVPGISSVNAAAAAAGISLGLGDERIAVLPANYLDSLRPALERFDTVVLLKVHRVFDEVRSVLTEMRLASRAVYVARAGMADERIVRDITSVRSEDLNYFSLLIVRKQ